MTSYTNQAINIDNLPRAAEVNLMSLDPNYPKSVLVRAIFFQLIITIAFTIAYIGLNFPALLWLLLVFEILLVTTWSYKSAKACRFALREQDVIYRQGLWSQKTTAVSFNRIQHIDISHDPLERKYDIATIKLFTAGGSGADLAIYGLPKQTAQQLRQQVLAKINAEKSTDSESEQNHE